jgi:putative methionine-R-sulfoxide reductase with GAF domain
VVFPPFWKEGWFIGLLIGVVLMLLYLFVHWRTSVARKKEMEKTHIQKLKADDYKNQFELEQISNYFSSSLANKKTEDEVLWDVAGNLIGRMNYVDCIIYLWNEDKTKMVQKAAYGPKGKPEYISEQLFDVAPGQGVVGHVMQTMQPLLVRDTRTDSRYRVDDAFRLSEICVPIIHNNELLGIIDSEHHLPDYFTERDIKILTTIATLIGNKIKQIESERSLEVKGRELASINEQLAEARLSALQAQMNPHFVFNALNSIKRMILDCDNDRASRYLSKFALMIRMTLNHSKETFVTLHENIEYLKAYLEMEQLRFDDSFTYRISTDKNIDADETAIPSLMIQPIVENAIWHGLMQADADKKILIDFTQDHSKIRCTVEDNGIGIRRSEKLKEVNKPPHNSVGLENLKKRIKIINEKYDTDCSLEIMDLGDEGKSRRGTRVILQFNMINT